MFFTCAMLAIGDNYKKSGSEPNSKLKTNDHYRTNMITYRLHSNWQKSCEQAAWISGTHRFLHLSFAPILSVMSTRHYHGDGEPWTFGPRCMCRHPLWGCVCLCASPRIPDRWIGRGTFTSHKYATKTWTVYKYTDVLYTHG